MKLFYKVNEEVWTDLNPSAPDLWVLAGPQPLKSKVDLTRLPEGYRWVSQTEWQDAADNADWDAL